MDLGQLIAVVQREEIAHGKAGKRIVAVYHPQHGGQFDGVYGGCPITDGAPAYKLNDGTVVEVTAP